MTREQILGIARHLLTTVGGALVAKGVLDDATLTEVVGAVIAVAGAVWSVLSKKKAA
jgi:hypothetical protein